MLFAVLLPSICYSNFFVTRLRSNERNLVYFFDNAIALTCGEKCMRFIYSAKIIYKFIVGLRFILKYESPVCIRFCKLSLRNVKLTYCK